MGQVESDLRGPPRLPSPQVEPQPSSSMGQKLRLAWPVRRKKTLEPASALASPVSAQPKLKDQMFSPQTISPQPSLSSSPSSSAHSHDDQGRARNRTSAKQMASQFASNALMAMKGKLNASTTSVATPASPAFEAQTPPPLPPKPLATRLSTSSQSSVSTEARKHNEVDVRTVSPGPPASDSLEKPHSTEARSEVLTGEHNAPATQLAMDAESNELKVDNSTPTSEIPRAHSIRKRERKGEEEKANADDWRKSDSTLRTVRLIGPGGGMPVGARTPRPLSLAESTNSGNTVQPGNIVGTNANKRLSALIMDADFGMPEVDSEDDDDEVLVPRNFGIDLGKSSSNVPPQNGWKPPPAQQFRPHIPSVGNQGSPQSSPCPSPVPGKISKLVKAARRGSNSFTGRFSPSPRRGDKTHENPYLDSDHDRCSQWGRNQRLFRLPPWMVSLQRARPTTSVTSSPSQSSKDSSSLASSAFDQYSYSSADPPRTCQSEVVNALELHPWVSSAKASESSTSLSASTTSSSSHGNAYVRTEKAKGSSDVLQREYFDGDDNFAEARGSSESCSFNTAERSSPDRRQLNERFRRFCEGIWEEEQLTSWVRRSAEVRPTSPVLGLARKTGVPSSFHLVSTSQDILRGRSTSGQHT